MSVPIAAEGDEALTAGIDCLNRFATFHECPHCGGSLSAEHAHFKCTSCGWRDSCCD